MDRDAMVGALRASDEDWDFIVVGGGATGLGVAIDAASRGYRVASRDTAPYEAAAVVVVNPWLNSTVP